VRDSHIDFVLEKYKNLLNEFIELDLGDFKKKDCFKYYANEFRDKLKIDLFPTVFSKIAKNHSKKN
jgi:hypothetical protein